MIKGQRCLVTGGAGTIGSTIVDQLVDAGAAEVTVLDNFVRGRRENLREALVIGDRTRRRRRYQGSFAGLFLDGRR